MPNKTLLLLRHAKSERTIEVIDFERPLKKSGERDAKIMGHWMLANHLLPELILSSPAERAIRTAKKVCKAMALDKAIIQTDERIYNASPKLLKQVLHECSASLQKILLVGHNPAFEELLADLSAESLTIPDDGKLLPTTALAELEIPGTWAKLDSHCAKLIAITRVKSLYEID